MEIAMKEHKFDSNIESIYNTLSTEQKIEYKNKQDKSNKLSIVIGIIFAIILVSIIIGFGIWLSIEKEYALLAFTLVIAVLMGAIVFGFISFGIKGLKSTDELKIKMYIVRLERQKNIPTSNSLHIENATKNNISYYPSDEENNAIYRLSNKFCIEFAQNSDLCNIVKKNISIIKLPLLDIELACCPFQKRIIEEITYAPIRFNSTLKNGTKRYKTIFLLPTIDNTQKTQYSDFVSSWNNATIQNAQISLTKIIEYKLNRTSVMRGVYIETNKCFENFSKIEEIYSLLKRQQIIHNATEISVNANIIDVAQYNAFLFLIRNYLVENLRYAVKNVLQALNISTSASQQEIVTKLYDSPLIDRDSILTYYCILKYLEINDYTIPLTKIYYENYTSVQKIIQDLQDKAQLNDLRSGEYQKKQKYTMLEIDNMSDSEFETFIAKLFTSFGYQAEVTKQSGDQGVDVIAKKGNQTVAVQVKHYNQPVGNHAIMEVVGGATFYKATLCYVVTNNYFTKSAKELAASNNVILWDRDRLTEKLNEL